MAFLKLILYNDQHISFAFLSVRMILEFGKNIKMVETSVEGVEIDTPADLKRARSIWK